jgi:uncharacterized protein YegL
MGINYETKQPVVFVVDVSYSMEGEPIIEVQKGLKLFQEVMLSDYKTATQVEMALVVFYEKAVVKFDFSAPDEVSIPELECGPATCLGGGVLKAIELIENRKKFYKETGQNYSRPIIVLLTDGEPNGSEEILEEAYRKIQDMVSQKKVLLWSFGVEGADMNFLKKFTPNSKGCYVKKLADVNKNFLHFFQWLSNSISLVAAHQQDDEILEEIEEWMEEEDLFDSL